MAQPVKPVAKMVYVCDDVVRDPQSGKVSLLNLWDTVRPPPGSVFPYCLAKVCVFAWWRGGFGKVSTHIEIADAASGELVRQTRNWVIEFADRSQSEYA